MIAPRRGSFLVVFYYYCVLWDVVSSIGWNDGETHHEIVAAAAVAEPDKNYQENQGSHSDVHVVPSFTLWELQNGHRRDEFLQVLATTGLLAVEMVQGGEDEKSSFRLHSEESNEEYDSFSQARETALQGLCQCWSSKDDWENSSFASSNKKNRPSSSGIDTAWLKDGTTHRTTLATATLGHTKPLAFSTNLVSELSESCADSASAADTTATTMAAMEQLRDTVAHAAFTFVQAWDHFMYNVDKDYDTTSSSSRKSPSLLRTAGGTTFANVASIVQASQNLEHFHVYQNNMLEDTNDDDPAAADPPLVLDVHTDAGLFLAFVPGLSCQQQEESNDASTTTPKKSTPILDNEHFYISTTPPSKKFKSGKEQPPPLAQSLQRVIFPPGSVGIMLGAGAEHWLRQSQQHAPQQQQQQLPSVRATRHAVMLPPGQGRAWYGMMHMVPPDAIVQDFPQRTLADMRHAMVHQHDRTFGASQEQRDDTNIDIGCGSSSSSSSSSLHGVSTSRRRRLQMLTDASSCNNSTNFFCWMTCADIPQVDKAASYQSQGYSLYCLDPATLLKSNVSVAVAKCNKNNHDDSCLGQWQPTAEGVSAQLVLLPTGGGENGSSSSSSGETGGSVDQFEPPPTTGMEYCYGGTSMYMDGFHWRDTTCVIYLFPTWVLTSAGSMWGACLGTVVFGIALEAVIWKRRSFVPAFDLGSWQRVVASTVFYGIQLTMGYLIMLVVMIYSAPLFVSVVGGLMVGHALFNAGGAQPSKMWSVGCRKNDRNRGDPTLDSDVEVDGDTRNNGMIGPECCSGAGAGKDTSNTKRSHDAAAAAPEGITPCCQNTV